jgi:predicted RNase H-like nuclease (RuvC/YqgF family)
MNWLLRVFSQGKVRSSQPIADEKRQDLTNVMHVVIEETIMAGAQGLIGFIKRKLDDRTRAPEQVVDPSEQVVDPTNGESLTTVEELTSKVTVLIEQLYEWSSSTLVSGQPLNSPLNSVEQSVTQEGQKVDSIDRSVSLQEMSQKIDSLTQQLMQETQRVNALEAHINHLEKLLAKYSAIPKYVEQHHRAIATLQTRISDLEAPHQTNNHQPVLQLSNVDN